MKKSNSGFMLIETLLVSTFVLGVLTYLYLQFSALKRSYDDSFKYDTVPALYGVRNINQYIVQNGGYDSLKYNINTLGYYKYEYEYDYNCTATCTALFKELEPEKIYFVKDSIFKDNVNINTVIFTDDDELYHFAKKIAYSTDSESEDYHLIVKYKNGTFATIAITL